MRNYKSIKERPDFIYVSGAADEATLGVFPFCFFLAAHYARTKQMRKAVCAAMLPHGLDLDRVWSVKSHLTGNLRGFLGNSLGGAL